MRGKKKASAVVLTTIKLDAEVSAALMEIEATTIKKLQGVGVERQRLSRAELIRAAILHYAASLRKVKS